MITENKCRTDTRLWREEGSYPDTPDNTKTQMMMGRRVRKRERDKEGKYRTDKKWEDERRQDEKERKKKGRIIV